jgi:hypothetical protein
MFDDKLTDEKTANDSGNNRRAEVARTFETASVA